METHELLDRLEILFPTNSNVGDLRRAYIDNDISSIFRLLPDDISGDKEDLRKAVLESNLHSLFRLAHDDDLRKLVLEDNTWKLWPVLERYTDTQFVRAFKSFYVNNIDIDKDCFSRGQLQSKLWLVDKLKRCNVDLGTVFLCAGWYATLATMLFESNIKLDKVRSFDLDPSCIDIAKIFNKPWLMKDWQFQASLEDIHNINYAMHIYNVTRSDGSVQTLTDQPDTIINTSCEHISNFAEWYDKIPEGKLVVLQSNNFFEVEEHVNCVRSIEEFAVKAPINNILYSGELDLPKYRRFMLIGNK